MNNTKKNRLPLYIGIPVILLLIFLRFGLYFLKSDGFSGLSMLLPILLLLFILFALCTAAFFAAWVYQDCKKRGDDPVLWAIVVFIATPFIGLLIYFLRRSAHVQAFQARRLPRFSAVQRLKQSVLPAGIEFQLKQNIVKNVERILKIRRIMALWLNRKPTT